MHLSIEDYNLATPRERVWLPSADLEAYQTILNVPLSQASVSPCSIYLLQ